MITGQERYRQKDQDPAALRPDQQRPDRQDRKEKVHRRHVLKAGRQKGNHHLRLQDLLVEITTAGHQGAETGKPFINFRLNYPE